MINPMKEFGWKNVAFYWIAFIVLKIVIGGILQIFKTTRYNKSEWTVFFYHLMYEMIFLLLVLYLMSYLIENYKYSIIICFILLILGFFLNWVIWFWLNNMFVKNRSNAGSLSSALMNLSFFVLYSFFWILVFNYYIGQHLGELNPILQGTKGLPGNSRIENTDFSIFTN